MSCKPNSGLINSKESSPHVFADNLEMLKKKFGYPDRMKWHLRKGKKIAQVEADDPVSEATLFAGIASEGYVSEEITAHGYIRKLADGTVIGLRLVSSSDGSPAVDLNISGESYIRKIHFYKGDK